MKFKEVNDNFIKLITKKRKLHHYVSYLGLLLYIIMFAFCVVNFVDFANNGSWKIFFGIVDRFTWQSNFLLLLYTLFIIIKPNHSIFNNNRLLIMIMVYIFFTFVGYNVVLIGISGDRGYTGDALAIVKNLWVHAICPIYFIFYGFVFMFQNHSEYPEGFWKTLGYGMIYPSIYALYLITIPFIFNEYIENWEYFGNIKQSAYSVYGSATNTRDNPVAYAYIFIMLLLFVPGSFALFFYSWKGIDHFLQHRRYFSCK